MRFTLLFALVLCISRHVVARDPVVKGVRGRHAEGKNVAAAMNEPLGVIDPNFDETFKIMPGSFTDPRRRTKSSGKKGGKKGGKKSGDEGEESSEVIKIVTHVVGPHADCCSCECTHGPHCSCQCHCGDDDDHTGGSDDDDDDCDDDDGSSNDDDGGNSNDDDDGNSHDDDDDDNDNDNVDDDNTDNDNDDDDKTDVDNVDDDKTDDGNIDDDKTDDTNVDDDKTDDTNVDDDKTVDNNVDDDNTDNDNVSDDKTDDNIDDDNKDDDNVENNDNDSTNPGTDEPTSAPVMKPEPLPSMYTSTKAPSKAPLKAPSKAPSKVKPSSKAPFLPSPSEVPILKPSLSPSTIAPIPRTTSPTSSSIDSIPPKTPPPTSSTITSFPKTPSPLFPTTTLPLPTLSPAKDLYSTVSCDDISDMLQTENTPIEILYSYTIRDTGDASIDDVLFLIENSTLNAVSADFLSCDDKSDRRLGSAVGISALPEDRKSGICGDGCFNVTGGMTIYVFDQGDSPEKELLQCDVFNLIRETIENTGSEIDELLLSDSGSGLVCTEPEDGGGTPAAAVSMNASTGGGFPVALVVTNLVIFAAIVLLAIFLLKRRRRSTEEDLCTREVNELEKSILEDGLHIDRSEKPGLALLVGALGADGALTASSIGGFEGDHGDIYENGYDIGIGSSFIDTRDRKPSSKLCSRDVEQRARELGFETKEDRDSFCGGYFGGYAAGAGGRGFDDGYAAAASGKRNAKSLPPRVLMINARSMGYKDKDDIDAYCAGYSPGIVCGKSTNRVSSESGEMAMAFGSAYHDGFLHATYKKGNSRLSDSDLDAKARLLGLSEIDAIATYFSGYDAGFSAGEARRDATAAANAASRGYLDGYAAGASGVRNYSELSPRQLVKKSSALGYSNQEDVAGFCVGYRSGFLAANVSTIRADRVPTASNAFGTGYHDGIMEGKGKDADSDHTDEVLSEKSSLRGFACTDMIGAFSSGYRGGLVAGAAKRDAIVASTAASLGFRHGHESAGSASECTHTELVRKARVHGFVEPAETDAYCLGSRVGLETPKASHSNADDMSVSSAQGRVLSNAFGNGFLGGFLDGINVEQGPSFADSKVKDIGRQQGFTEKESLNVFCRGYRLGLHAGEARRIALRASGAFERGYLDGHSSAPVGGNRDIPDVGETALCENARALGFTDEKSIEGYTSGFQVGVQSRRAKRWGTVGTGRPSSSAAAAATSYGRGYQYGFMVGSELMSKGSNQNSEGKLSDVEKEEIARAMGIAKVDEIACFCSGFSDGHEAAKDCFEARLQAGGYGHESLDEQSDAYSQGYEDGFALGLSQLTSEGKNDDLDERLKAAKMSRPELEVKGLGLGFSSQKAIDSYCSGFWAGYVGVQGHGLGEGRTAHSLCNVHWCISSSCPMCRKANAQEPTFVSTGEHYTPVIEAPEDGLEDDPEDAIHL